MAIFNRKKSSMENFIETKKINFFLLKKINFI